MNTKIENRNVVGTFAAAALLMVVGCAHSLELCNIYNYRDVEADDLSHRGTKVNVICNLVGDSSSWAYCEELGKQLCKKGGYSVQTVGGGDKGADFTISCNVEIEESGDVLNFLVSWPGFVLLTPAWLGYSYNVDFQVRCKITSIKANKDIGEFEQTQNLHLRYADFGTTWAANFGGWFLFHTIPAAINGIYVIGYDDDITPLLYAQAYPILCETIASKCISIINGSLDDKKKE